MDVNARIPECWGRSNEISSDERSLRCLDVKQTLHIFVTDDNLNKIPTKKNKVKDEEEEEEEVKKIK